jgi:gag-polypeptide of LTR copia-type
LYPTHYVVSCFLTFTLIFVPIGPIADEINEKSNKLLVNFLLNGDNYLNWARAIKLALGGQSKLEHILGRTKTVGETLATETEQEKSTKRSE